MFVQMQWVATFVCLRVHRRRKNEGDNRETPLYNIVNVLPRLMSIAALVRIAVNRILIVGKLRPVDAVDNPVGVAGALTSA